METHIEDAAAIFVGTARTIQSIDGTNEIGDPRIVVYFDVSRAWKGVRSTTAVLHTVQNGASCDGYFFHEGAEYLVFAFPNEDGTLGTTICSYTDFLEHAQDTLTALGPAPTVVEEAQTK